MLQYCSRISIHCNTRYTEFIHVVIWMGDRIFAGTKYYMTGPFCVLHQYKAHWVCKVKCIITCDNSLFSTVDWYEEVQMFRIEFGLLWSTSSCTQLLLVNTFCRSLPVWVISLPVWLTSGLTHFRFDSIPVWPEVENGSCPLTSSNLIY